MLLLLLLLMAMVMVMVVASGHVMYEFLVFFFQKNGFEVSVHSALIHSHGMTKSIAT